MNGGFQLLMWYKRSLIRLSDDYTARKYWNKLAQRLREEESEVVDNLSPVEIASRRRKNARNRLRQYRRNVPHCPIHSFAKSRAAEKMAGKVGYERVQEIEDPELATKRTRMLYKLKGYDDDWIEKRMRGIAIREQLTDEWQKRGAQEKRDYEILTAEISRATFGVTPSEYKKLKGLKRENLRDHMDDFELIFHDARRTRHD